MLFNRNGCDGSTSLERGFVAMKVITRIIVTTLLVLSASSICLADPPDPPAPPQSQYTIQLPG
jgi:hypothetical protein